MRLNKSQTVWEYHKGTKSDYVWDESEKFSTSYASNVEKVKGKDFIILTLDDVHFSDYGYRVFFGFFNVLRIKRLVAQVKPDLIILPGDIVCEDSVYYCIKKLTDLMESFGIPWAPVFGNHDDEANCDLDYLAEVMMSAPHCLMKKGDSSMGVGNYIVNITQDGDIVESIFMMDSHHSQPNERQCKWFKWAADGINTLAYGNCDISAFMHIPVPEFQTAYDLAYDKDAKKWKNGYGAHGELYESICCERYEDGRPHTGGFFDAFANAENANNIFCAHDHMNDFSVIYKGIRLTYLMKLGKCSGYQPGFDGGTVITVGSDGIKRITHKTFFKGDVVDIDI